MEVRSRAACSSATARCFTACSSAAAFCLAICFLTSSTASICLSCSVAESLARAFSPSCHDLDCCSAWAVTNFKTISRDLSMLDQRLQGGGLLAVLHPIHPRVRVDRPAQGHEHAGAVEGVGEVEGAGDAVDEEGAAEPPAETFGA